MGKNSKRMKIDGRTYRAALDKFLADKHLKRKFIAKDGSCLFRAVSEQVYGSQCYHHKVRLKCMEYIRVRAADFKEFITVPLDDYLDLLSKELWGGEVELVVLSRLYNRSIVVYNELSAGREVQEQVFPSVEDYERSSTVDKLTNPILLAYSDGNHYDSVFSARYMDATSFCQGILYTMLVEKVFKQNVPYYCKRKLAHLQESDINSIVKYSHGQEKHVQNDGRLYSTLGRYGLDVVVAMSWTMYHNAILSLHRWEKDGVEQRDRHIAASIQFHVGNRCYFYIDGKRMNGEIAALNVKPGVHLVRVYQSQKERWEIPFKDITLLSSHSTASGQQGKPHPSGEQSGHTNNNNTGTPGSSGVGGKDARSRQPKEKAIPTTEVPAQSSSLLGAPPVTTNSSVVTVPSGSVKKGKTTTQSQQKGYSKRRPSGNSAVTPTDTTPRQQTQEHSRTKPGTAKSPKTDHVGGVSPAVPGAGLPGSATLEGSNSARQPTSPNPTKAPYSSVVKKTAGGPSGSLTSEGTEYDESSGDDAAQEESKDVHLPEPSKFPAPHQSQQQQQQGVTQLKTGKPLSMGQGKGRATTTDNNITRESKSEGKSEGRSEGKSASVTKLATTGFQQADTSLKQADSPITSTQDIAPTVIPRCVQDSPYLEPQIPRVDSSQPQDAWPEMPQASCNTIPPQNTMIYAAVMTNRSNQDPESPLTSSSARTTSFPYSASAADKTHFPNTVNPQHVMSSHTPNPPLLFTAATRLQTLPQPGSASDHTMLGANNTRGYPLPGGSPHQHQHHVISPHAHPQFQSNYLPVGVLPQERNLGTHEMYSTAGIQRTSSSPQVGPYNSGRSPRMNEGTTNTLPLQGTTGVPLPYSTVAAAMEMRSMLGIEGRQPASNMPVYARSNNFPMSASTSTTRPVVAPITVDNFAQTLPLPATSAKAVQVGVERSTVGVQASGPSRSSSETQTSGLFVPAEDLAPAQDIQMESLADQLVFAVKYSLQCLSAFSRTTGSGNSEVEAALTELLDSEQIKQLEDQVAQNSNLTASQQDFLRSVGNMPGGHGDGQPLTPQSADFSRNEEVTPQQEQHHMQSPGMPRMNMPPPAFPFMMPPHPFMLPPRMYYPFMTPMPVPPPMGYAPMVPPMLPRQVVPPRLSPSPEGRMGEQQQQGGANLLYSTPDNAHHNQDQLQQDDAEVDGGDPPQQLPPPTQLAQSSEMVASSVYPIPVVQASAPPPGPDVVGAEAPEDQFRSTHLQKEQDDVVQQSSEGPELTVSNNGGKDQASRPTAEEASPTSTSVVSSLQKQPHQSTTRAATSQLKSQKAPRKSSQPTSSHDHPTTGNANQPGLPCRPSSYVQGSGSHTSRPGKHSHQGGRGKGQGGGGGGGGEGQRRTTAKSKTGGTRGTGSSNSKKVEPNDLNNTEGAKKKSSRSSRTGEKQQVQDHTGSPAVSGPSPKSNQDPTRNFSPRSRSRSSSSNSGALLDTKAFKWGVPSPSANPDVILDSTPADESTNCQPEPEESEWPDLSELGISSSSSSNKQKQTFSASLKFSNPAPIQYPSEQSAGVVWDGPAETDSIEDPFPTVQLHTWHSDLGDFPLTLSPSQSICLAQCTGDLNKLDQATNLHKH